ncbi:MAG: amidohydrolase family protein [Deferribacteraceae bacterium]|jgi:N-acyl-D-aspartate/D-glutamate deacylase|nr:amidohydrolase family protein [Deferribacteraceae bacterium]
MYDILIKNAMIVDGSGAAPFAGDVAIQDGLIKAVAQGIKDEAKTVYDAAGAYLTPGFIDIHRHSDAFVFREGFGEIQLRQGITTTINGNCGLSIVPCPANQREDILRYLKPIMGRLPDGIQFDSFSSYLTEVGKTRLPLNFGMHIGNGTLRAAAKGFEAGKRLSASELAIVHKYLKDAIDNGAFGLSMGIVYVPENMYDVEGFIEALEPIRGGDIPIVTHIRGEGDLLLSSLKEVIQIAKALNVPLHVSHFKSVGKLNWGGKLQEAIALLDAERAAGMRITCDVYPWTAGSTQLVQVLPPELLEGGLAKTTERLRDPQKRAECRAILEKPQTYFENQLYLIGWENIMVTSVQTEAGQKYVGKRMTEIAQMQGKDPYEAAFDLLADENFDVSMVNFIVCDEDIETILRYPHSCIISDSIYPDGGKPHPRQYGTFPKILQQYVKEKSVLTIEQAVYKFTGKPAEIMKIAGKGLIKEGFDADVAVFDLADIRCNADYIEPAKLATGFRYVFVNGQLANDHDSFVNTGCGKVLRRNIR